MQIYISVEATEDEEHWPDLDLILREQLASERHAWDNQNAAALIESRWAKERPLSHKRLRELATERFRMRSRSGLPLGASSPRPALRVEVHPATPSDERSPHLSPNDARRYLEHHPVVVVENGEAEMNFLLAICRAFARDVLATALRTSHIELDHAGGSAELPKRFREQVRRAPRGPLRVMVMRDSDALYPGHEDSALCSMRKDFCEYRDHLVVLPVREIENYLTCACLRLLCDDRAPMPNLEALRTLTHAQRAHYDMERGFASDRGALDNALRGLKEEAEKSTIREARRRLYEGADVAALHNGFTKNVKTLYAHERLAEVYRREEIAEELGDEAAAALESLLDAMEALL